MPFVTAAWVALEGVMFCEINQKKNDNDFMVSLTGEI